MRLIRGGVGNVIMLKRYVLYQGPQFISLAYSVLGVGVFNSDGKMWKFHRSMTRPFFSKDRISHFELFGRHADAAISSMKSRFAEGVAVDFQVRQ